MNNIIMLFIFVPILTLVDQEADANNIDSDCNPIALKDVSGDVHTPDEDLSPETLVNDWHTR